MLCGIEQIKQYVVEGDFCQWFFKDWFVDCVDCEFKFFNVGIGWNLIGIDVQFGNFMIIVVEKGDKVFCQIVFIFFVQ